MPDQQPLLFVACAPEKPPKCGQPERCLPSPQPPPPDPPPPELPQADASSGDMAMGGAAGLAGGLLLARVLRGQKDAPPPAPKNAPPARGTPVRVRHDLDPVEPSEARHGPDGA